MVVGDIRMMMDLVESGETRIESEKSLLLVAESKKYIKIVSWKLKFTKKIKTLLTEIVIDKLIHYFQSKCF